MTNLEQAIRTMQELEAHRQKTEQVNLIVEIFSRIYDRATAYTNAVILAGYVAIFAVWGFTREMLSVRLNAIVGLLMTVSCATFVAWEVYKSVMAGLEMRKLSTALRATPEKAIETYERFQKESGKHELMQGRLWAAVVIVCVLTGFSAALIMSWVFVCSLFGA